MKYVVIGGGIVGACAAYYLSKKEDDVLLIDKEFEGKATLAGAGIICPWISRVDDPDWFAIASRGALYYPELIDSLKEDGETETGYAHTGALAVGTDLNQLKEVKEKAEWRKREHPEVGEVKLLEAPGAQEYFPPLSEELHGVYISGSARLDGRLLGNSLINAFQKNGGRLLEEKVEFKKLENGKAAVITSDGVIEADEIIVAGGAWTNFLLEPLGLKVSQEAQRGQIAHLTLDEDTSSWPVVLPQDSSHYLVAFEDQRVALGATRETGSGFDYRLTAGGVAEVLNEGIRVAPGLEEATLKEVRIGFRPLGSDIRPILGRVPQYDNVTIVTGLGASGLTMGPYAGSIAAKLAMGEEVELDLSPYDPLRMKHPE
jgi:D-amino-acid dehydrogenase